MVMPHKHMPNFSILKFPVLCGSQLPHPWRSWNLNAATAPIEARKLSMASWDIVRESVIASADGRDRSSQSWIAGPKVRCERRRGATYLLTQRPR